MSGGHHPKRRPCCPMEEQQIDQTDTLPRIGSDQGDQSGETVVPLGEVGLKTHQQPDQQCGPDLPLNGALGVADKSGEFEGLLNLFEEDLDGPSGLIELCNRSGGPIKIVGQEHHGLGLAVDLELGHDPAHEDGVGALTGGPTKLDDLILEDPFGAIGLDRAFDPVAHVVLGPCDPEYAPLRKFEQMIEVDIGLVEDDDLTGLEPGAQADGALIVVVGGLFDDGDAGKEILQIEPQVKLRRRFAPPVFGPVHAVGHQGNGRGIHRIDRSFEAPGQSAVTTRRPETRGQSLQIAQSRPEQTAHQFRISTGVGMAERVARGGTRPAKQTESRKSKRQRIADIGQRDAVAQLAIQQAHHMAPGIEAAGELLLTQIPGYPAGRMRRYHLAKLREHAQLRSGWLYSFHTADS